MVEGSRGAPQDVMTDISASKRRHQRHIPHDLILEILSRVPGRTLVRFRCVSKLWFSSFRDPHFVSLQLNQATKNPTFLLSYIVDLKDLGKVPFCSLEIVATEETNEIIASSKFIINVESDKYCMSNPCNGLIAFHGWYNAYVANPCTREWMALPKVTPHTDSMFQGFDESDQPHIGLGFSMATREYKLVRFFYRCSSWGCEVLTLGTDHSWRSLEDVPFCITEFEPAYDDGCIYWTAVDGDGNLQTVSFDVCREEFAMIPLPSCLDPAPYGRYRYVCMRVLEGSLCLVDFRMILDEELIFYCPVMHIFALEKKHNHNKDIWSAERRHSIRLKKIRVRTKSGGTRGLVAYSMYPLVIEDGFVLLYTPIVWKLHNIDTGVTCKLEFYRTQDLAEMSGFNRHWKAFECVESIVPVDLKKN